MLPDNPFRGPLAPFSVPVDPPDVDPFVAPFFEVKFNTAWTPYVLGALTSLVLQTTWKTDDEAVLWLAQKRAMSLLICAASGYPGERPFWETPDDLEDETLPEYPWYEQISDWIIEGFLATTFTPQAAIVYSSTIPKMRLVFRSGDLAGTVRVLIDGIEVLYEDLYSETPQIIERVVEAVPVEGFRASLLGTEPPYQLRIEKADESTETRIDVVLGDIRPEQGELMFRQPSHCTLQYSDDGGENYSTIYTGSDCVTDGINSAISNETVATPQDIEDLGRATPPDTTTPAYSHLCAGIKAVMSKIEDYLDAVLADIDLSKELMAIVSDCTAITVAGDIVVDDILALVADSTAAGTAAIRAAKGANGWDEMAEVLYCLGKEDGGFFRGTLDSWRLWDWGTNLWKIAMVGASKAVSWLEWATVYAVGATNEDNSCEAGYVCGWCYEFNFTASDGGWSSATGYSAVWSTAGWAGNDAENMDRVFIQRTFDETYVTEITVTLDNAIPDNYGFWICPGVSDVSCSQDSHSPGQTVFTKTVEDLCDVVSLGGERGGENTSAWGHIISVRITGTGDNPFGSNNC